MTTLSTTLRQHVDTLASKPRKPGTLEHASARAYIRDQLSQAGFQAADCVYTGIDMDAVNIETQPTPANDGLPLLVVGAHYDSIPDSCGADDNASAVAVLLELAKWIGPRLANADCTARLQLVAYDLEEYGMLGSMAHCVELCKNNETLRGMISLEMLGYVDDAPGSQNLPPMLVGQYPDVGNFIGVVGNEQSASLLETALAGMKTVAELPVEFMAVPGDGSVVPETRLSDHSSFWDHGLPALMITDTAFFRNPHYHKPTDTPDTLDYEFMAKVTEGVCAAVWRLVTI